MIPKGGEWMDADLNVMLIGLHGVGKTYAVREWAEKKDLKLKYYSCSTLDPYTDLVGIPVPIVDDSGRREIEMVRPRDIDEAEILFFDEFNRADDKVLDAVMEIVQFHSINGEPLPKLRMVWAAMNPPGQEDNVSDLDPSLVDRFDVYEEVTPAPSVEFLVSVGVRKGIAKALVGWYTEQNRNRRDTAQMITPRRLEKIGLFYEKTGDYMQAIPLWFKDLDRKKLGQMLQDAENREKAMGNKRDGSPSTGPTDRFEYSDEYFKNNAFAVASYLRDNQGDLETHNAAFQVLENRQAKRLVRDFGDIVASLTPAIREAMMTDMNDGKFNRLTEEVKGIPSWRTEQLTNLTRAVEAEAKIRETK
jgi:hypothetical protein